MYERSSLSASSLATGVIVLFNFGYYNGNVVFFFFCLFLEITDSIYMTGMMRIQ